MSAHCSAGRDETGPVRAKSPTHGAAIILEVLEGCGDDRDKKLRFLAQYLSDLHNRGRRDGD